MGRINVRDAGDAALLGVRKHLLQSPDTLSRRRSVAHWSRLDHSPYHGSDETQGRYSTIVVYGFMQLLDHRT